MESRCRRASVNPVGVRPVLLGLAALAAIATFVAIAPGANAATGGPDFGGYRYIDSLEAGNPLAPSATYSAISTDSGAQDVTADVQLDETTDAVPIGFTFDYYGTGYTSAYINENGFIGFDPAAIPASDDALSWAPAGIPDSGIPNAYVAGLFVDYDATCAPAGGAAPAFVSYQTLGTAPNRHFVVQWEDVPIFNGPSPQCSVHTATFQVRLLENGNKVLVVIQDAEYTPCGQDACATVTFPPDPEAEPVYDSGTLIGIEQNGFDGTTTADDHGLEYFFQEYGVTDPVNLSGRAILFYRNAAPVAVSPGTITLNENCLATASTVQCPAASGAPFTLQGTDADGNSLTFCLDTAPTQGTLETAIPACPTQSSPAIAPAGTPPASSLSNKYIPTGNNCNNGGTVPLDTLVFRVKDASLSSAAATVSFSITCVNDAPTTTTPHTLTVDQDSAATSLTLTGADVDLTMISDTLSWCIVAAPANGAVTGHATCPTFGANLGTYQPNAGYCNSPGGTPDTYSYKVKDAAGLEATGTVSVTVTCSAVAPPPPPPPPQPPGPNQKPKAAFGMAPSPARVGDIVSFEDGSSDPDAGDVILQWRWTFGEGSTSANRNPTHVYGATGNFQVCLAVADTASEWSKPYCVNLQVNGAAPAQQPQPGAPAPVENQQAQQQPAGGQDGQPRTLSVTIDGPTAAAPGDEVTLVARSDGSAATTYAWQQLMGNAVTHVSGATLTFTVPADAESLFFAVTASDGADRGTLTRTILVGDEAGDISAKVEGPAAGTSGATVSLDGSGSEGASSFTWTQVSGPAVTLQGARTATPTVRLGAPGTVTLLLVAENGASAATATHTISVAPAAAVQDGPDEGDADDGPGASVPDDDAGDGDVDAAGDEAQASGPAMPVWVPYAAVGFVAAFVAVGAALLLRRRA